MDTAAPTGVPRSRPAGHQGHDEGTQHLRAVIPVDSHDAGRLDERAVALGAVAGGPEPFAGCPSSPSGAEHSQRRGVRECIREHFRQYVPVIAEQRADGCDAVVITNDSGRWPKRQEHGVALPTRRDSQLAIPVFEFVRGMSREARK